jgi:hypothetical protein
MVVAVDHDDLPGFVLTRGADVYGRCIALVGRGDPPGTSGRTVNVDIKLLRKTVNHRLLTAGFAYPTFYAKLYVDLRRELAKQAGAARDAGKGVFARDRTQKGVEVTALTTLTDDAVLLPKLFRRLADYLHLNGDDPSLAGFTTFLSQQDDQVWVVPAGQKTSFDTVVAVSGQTVRLKRLPEDLVFEEK